MRYWTNFAKFGDPNGHNGDLEPWPKYMSDVMSRGKPQRVYGRGGSDSKKYASAEVLELSDNILPYNYSLDRFEFTRSLRRNGLLPTYWWGINVTALDE